MSTSTAVYLPYLSLFYRHSGLCLSLLLLLLLVVVVVVLLFLDNNINNIRKTISSPIRILR